MISKLIKKSTQKRLPIYIINKLKKEETIQVLWKKEDMLKFRRGTLYMRHFENGDAPVISTGEKYMGFFVEVPAEDSNAIIKEIMK